MAAPTAAELSAYFSFVSFRSCLFAFLFAFLFTCRFAAREFVIVQSNVTHKVASYVVSVSLEPLATREPDGTACFYDRSFIPVCSARLGGSTQFPHIGFANSLEGDGEPLKCRRLQEHPSETAPGARRSSILTPGTRTPFHLDLEGHLDQEHFYFLSALNNALEASR